MFDDSTPTSALRLLQLPCNDKENQWDGTLLDDIDECSMCSHAMARGRNIYGTRLSPGGKDWISWKTTLDHPVGRICSNHDGSIVVASTAAGTVSLLAGKDGSVLATRMVTKSQGVASIDFCSSSTHDTLSIVVPDSSQSSTQVILVSNIDGSALNDERTVAEATKNMTIAAISFPLSNVMYVKAVQHEERLRFAVVTHEGKLCFYDLANKEVTSIGESSLEVQVSAGLKVHRHPPTGNSYFVFSTNGKSYASSVVWLETSHLMTATEIAFKNMVVGLEPLHSCCDESALALAVATKDVIQVIQACVEETMGLILLEGIHVIFQVPMPGKNLSTIDKPYSFRFLSQGNAAHQFEPSPFAGHVRLLLDQGRFDEATIFVQEKSSNSRDFSDFHPSELYLRRLQHALRNQVSPKTLTFAHSCLQKLIQLDGSDLALNNLITAADDVLKWHAPSIGSYQIALSTMSQMLDSVEAPPMVIDRIKKKRRKLECAREAMEALLALLNNVDAPMEGPFSDVRNMPDLLRTLLLEGLFGAVSALTRSNKAITPEMVVSAIVSLPQEASMNPRQYVPLLESAIVGLSVRHGLLPSISAWACQTANALAPDLSAAIFLLEHVQNALNVLHASIFSSYASFCPFVEANSRLTSPKHLDAFASFQSSDCTSIQNTKKKHRFAQSVPTILELGKLRGGAVKGNRLVLDSDDDCDDIEVKLRHALLLQKARSLGFDGGDLRCFASNGGVNYLALQLVQFYSRGATCHESRIEVLQSKIKDFCDESEVSFDDVVVSYAEKICDSKELNLSMVKEAASLARCCVSDGPKCKITLTLLRAALLCGASAPCLTSLSQQAIHWAGDDPYMRSELTEASRLLVISRIAVTYCGRDAALELFRVDNPSHAIKLLSHVCRHITYPEALTDAFLLCDAFANATKEYACIQMMEVGILSGTAEICSKVMMEIISKDTNVAKVTWKRSIDFCSATMLDVSRAIYNCKFLTSQCEQAMQLCSKGLALLEVVQNCFTVRVLGSTAFKSILKSYQRIQRLQRHHDVFVSPFEIDSPGVQLRIVRSLVCSIRESFGEVNTDSLASFEKARRASQLLVGVEKFSSIWFAAVEQEACHLVWSKDDGKPVQFLAESGALHNLSNKDAAHAVLSVVLAFCQRASQGSHESGQNNIAPHMKSVLRASQLLHNYVLVGCHSAFIADVTSLSCLTETIARVLLLADDAVGDELQTYRSQLRVWTRAVSSMNRKSSSTPYRSCFKIVLHHEWYVGDGLLLPLGETQESCIDLCLDLAGLILCNDSPNLWGSNHLLRVLHERGAHAMALRIGCLTIAEVLSFSSVDIDGKDQNLASLASSCNFTLQALAERSLGGSGNGITNPKVDCGLALSYMHLLPLKSAFHAFKASLPSAITTRDFKRLRALSSIGVMAAKGMNSIPKIVSASWTKQGKFVEQCQQLSVRASWWEALEHFKVDFEPYRFDDASLANSEVSDRGVGARQETHYAVSLLAPLIAKSCAKLRDVETARNITYDFAVAFGIDKQIAALKLIEFLLSCPTGPGYSDDVRCDLSLCEKGIRISMKDIPSVIQRAAVLRKALIGLESTDESGKDYERYGLILALYFQDLTEIVDRHESKSKVDAAPFVAELEAIARRRDALSVLLSFFEGELRKHRPPFPKFFTALPTSFGVESECERLPTLSVLGPIDTKEGKAFDSIGPLHSFFLEHSDASMATALAPLCVPLSLPSGYIHARALIARFQMSVTNGKAPPPLETDVLPVLIRLKSSRSQSTLAEWCATWYNDNDDQKAKCLDIALEQAMKASSEIEDRVGQELPGSKTNEERDALERVRRISSQKSMLIDKNRVKEIILKSKFGDADHFRAAKKMLNKLTTSLNDRLWSRADAAPDKFVEMFLTEAAAITAIACLSLSTSFALDHLRYTATIVHKVCKDISDQYSHVHVGAVCRNLARTWLVQGESVSHVCVDRNGHAAKMQKELRQSFNQEESETINFVMDLNDFGNEDRMWQGGSRPALQDQKGKNLVTREEEPLVLDDLGSAREVSESACARIALQIAFVMSFSEGYHGKESKSLVNGNENAGDSNNVTASNEDEKKPLRRGLLSRAPVGESNHDTMVMNHGRELLHVVFASYGVNKDRKNRTFASCLTTTNDLGVKSATFAMRYRALRTAAILCPLEALERIVKDEGFLATSSGNSCGSLRQCTFGSFVAKEIEEMGLTLPHSNLAQLSTMQFSSYARALRRNQDIGTLKAKGRLLLLLVEMSTMPGQFWDLQLVAALLLEMRSAGVPRSLLYACERCVEYVDSDVCDIDAATVGIISESIEVLVDWTLEEARSSLSLQGIPTLSRVAVLALRVEGTKPQVARTFAERIRLIMEQSSDEGLQMRLSEILVKLHATKETNTDKASSIPDPHTLRGRIAILHGVRNQ